MSESNEGPEKQSLRGDDRIDLSKSIEHGAQMISSPPAEDSEIPQALIGTPTAQDSTTSSDD